MVEKQRFASKKKEGEITRLEKSSVNYQAELALKNIKENAVDMILIAINSRTTIEIPANLTQAERDERVANYIKIHGSKI